MKSIISATNFMFFFALLLVFGFLVDHVEANGQDNVTGEEIGKLILASAPSNIQSGSDLDKARYAYNSYCNALTEANTSDHHGLIDSLKSLDHADALESIFHGMGISSYNTFKIIADKINSSGYQATEPINDGFNTSISQNDSNAIPNGQDMNLFRVATAVAYVDRLYIFDPWTMAQKNNDHYTVNNSSEWNGMDIRAWGKKMNDEGYFVFKDEGDSWYYSVEEIEDKAFKRPSHAGEYQIELEHECENCSQSAKHAAKSEKLTFIVLPNNEVIGIIEGKEESHKPGDGDSINQVNGTIYGYYDSRTNELAFSGIQSQNIEYNSSSPFVTYDYVKSGQAQIIDARTPVEFAASGAIPGAVNIPFDQVYSNGKFKEDASLSTIFAALDKNRPVVVYTTTGIKASIVWFALKLSGYDAKIYTWNDWHEHEKS